MLTFQVLENHHPSLEERILGLEPSIAQAFPELDRVTLRIRVKRLSGALAEYDHRSLRVDIDPRYFEPDEANRLPSVLAHETMHALQHIDRRFPYGERSCDVYTFARLSPLMYPKAKDFYVRVPLRLLENNPSRIRDAAERAIDLRSRGLRNYIVWFEEELKKKKI